MLAPPICARCGTDTAIDRELGERAALEDLVGQKAPGVIEEEDAQALVRERTHRHDQILPKLSIEGIDSLSMEAAFHARKRGVPGFHYQRDDGGFFAEHAPERFA